MSGVVNILTIGSTELDVEQRRLSGPRGHVLLTDRYLRLAARLMRRPGTVVSQSDLIGALYDDPDDEPGDPGLVLRQAVSRLRTVLDALGGRTTIRAERDLGYRIQAGGKDDA